MVSLIELEILIQWRSLMPDHRVSLQTLYDRLDAIARRRNAGQQ